MKRALAVLLLLLSAGRLSAALPATDNFGYTAASIPFIWTDISGTGTPISSTAWLPNADDGSVQVDLPFNFRFYGSTYTKVYLSTNGYIQFGTSSSYYAPNCLNVNTAPLNIAAAYWMDLDPSAGGTVHEEVLGLAPNRAVVLQFTGVPPRLGTGTLSFQIVLNEDQSLDFFYTSTATHDSGASASAGLRAAFDCPNHLGLPISCSQAILTDGTAIRFSYPSVEPSCGTPTNTSTRTISPTFSLSPTRSDTPTISPTSSETPTSSASPTETPTFSITPTFSHSPSITETSTESPSGTISPTFSHTATATATPSISPTDTHTGTISPSFSISPTFSETPSITETSTQSPSSTESPTATASPTQTATPSVSSSLTPSPTATRSPTATATGTATCSPTRTATPTLTITTTFSFTRTNTATPTITCTLFPPASKPACLVVGQGSFTANSLSAPGNSNFNSPGAVALDSRITPFRLYVADTANHRVLFWNDASAITAGTPADGVIGQFNFSANSANHGGPVAANGLSSPRGLAVDPVTGALWVADSGNHRVLRFSLPLSLSGSAADQVLGQGGSFTSGAANLGGLSASSLQDPRGISTDAFGSLAVADTGNHRVLRFSNPGSSSVADASWGQGDNFFSGTANLGGLHAQSLNAPQAALLLANQLWIADTGNNRVLQYSLALPLTQSASLVLGQPDFSSSLANRGLAVAQDNGLDTPVGLALDLSSRLLISDRNNNRVVGFDPPWPSQAIWVWGQVNLGFKTAGVGSDNLNSPLGIAANGATLIVADSANHRALAYGCGAGLQPSTATPSFTPTPSITPSFTASPTPSISPTNSSTGTISPSFSTSPTRTLSNTRTVSFTPTCTPSITVTFSASPTPSCSPTVTVTVVFSASPSFTAVPTTYPQSNGAVISYPNPASLSGGYACFAFPRAGEAQVQLYDLLGQPVATLSGGNIRASQGLACWDLKNGDGRLVAPGLYYVRVLADGQAHLAKLTVSP